MESKSDLSYQFDKTYFGTNVDELRMERNHIFRKGRGHFGFK